MPNIYVCLAALLAFIAYSWKIHDMGYESAAQKCTIAAQGSVIKGKDDTIQNRDQITARERELGNKVTALEKDHHERENYIRGLQLANGRLRDATCGVFDKNGRTTAGGGFEMSAAAGTPGGPGGPKVPLACLLPREDEQDLRALATDADLSELDAATGADYATQVAPLINRPLGDPP